VDSTAAQHGGRPAACGLGAGRSGGAPDASHPSEASQDELLPCQMKRQMIRIIILVTIACILASEGMIRILGWGSPKTNPTYVEMSRSFPELDDLIADAHNAHPSPKYYEEFIYAAAPASTKHINYTDYYSARWTPDSVQLHDADYIVWTFGGSTMENTETTDRLTIANTLAKSLNHALGPTHVKNFGTGGFFSSYELIKFQRLLREVPENELPSIALFYDGYNDSYFGFQYGPGNMQTDLSLKLQAMVEHKNLVMWTYAASRMLMTYSHLWRRTGARLVEHLLFPLAEPNIDDGILAATVRIYTSNVRMIQATCDVYRIRCFFILQPLIVTKQPLTPLEQVALDEHENHPRFRPEGTRFIRNFYERAKHELVDKENFIDASHILDGRSESDFYDLGHTSALTSPVIGEKIAEMILVALTTEK
jgi:hypothetical protein